MSLIWSRIAGIWLMATLLLPGMASASDAAPIVIVADTRGITGLMAWWGNLYNESLILFAALTVVLIPVIGIIFGVLADIVMSHIGIDLKTRELAEH